MKKILKKNGVKMNNKPNDKIEVRRKDITYSYDIQRCEKIDVWETIKNQIERNLRKRFNWKLILGDTLTKVVLRLKMSGASPTEAYIDIINKPILLQIKETFPGTYEDMCEKIKIGVCARYGENEQAIKLFNREFRDKSVEVSK